MDNEAKDVTKNRNGKECRQHRQRSTIGLTNIHSRWRHPQQIVTRAGVRYPVRHQRTCCERRVTDPAAVLMVVAVPTTLPGPLSHSIFKTLRV
jgi:hypothetical protein